MFGRKNTKGDDALMGNGAKHWKDGELRKVELHNGRDMVFYKATLLCGNERVHVAYDCQTGELVIHNWYIIPEDEIDEVIADLKERFASM